MRQSIFNKFILSYLIFALLGFLLLNFLAPDLIFNKLASDQAETLISQTDRIAKSISKSATANNSKEYTRIINNSLLPSNSNVWICNKEGMVLFTNSKTFIPKITSNDLDLFNENHYYLGNYRHYYNSESITVYSSVTKNDKVNEYVFLTMPSSVILNNTMQINNIFYKIYYVIFFTSFIFLLVFILCVYLPIRSIRKATIEFAQGNFSYQQLNIKTQDEMGELSDSLNYMAKQLNEAEEYQQRFISNISHDFRSPLTSIKGYLQAMIDGTIPPELHEKYLNVVLSEANRLEGLTNGLIDLGNWGSSGPGLVMEEFDLDELIRGVIQTFEGRCQQHEITIVYESSKTMVNADRQKIQQVIYNLVDNAIKFSPHNSKIKISVYSKGNKYYCSIKDFGEGISEENLSRIWNRFFKTDSSRGKDKTGSGIGLSIVKEIINAHNQTIDVISTKNVGTEFIFSLEKA